jgi:hypothetical protein
MVTRMTVTSTHRADPDTISIRIPFRLAKRGGRKEMQLPEDAPRQQQTDGTVIKALARAFRWKQMLETGEYASIAELAEREGIASSYMTRLLRLTLLAPEVVERTLAGGQPPEVTMASALEPFPVAWRLQVWTRP